MGIIAETWKLDEKVQLNVHQLTGRHRLTGAITLGAPAAGGALLFRKCSSLHGWFMRQPLEAVFLNRAGDVLVVAELRPWRFRSCRKATHALELAPGECARLGIARGKNLQKIAI